MFKEHGKQTSQRTENLLISSLAVGWMTVLLQEKSAKPCQNNAHSQKQTEILWSLLLTGEMQRKIQGYPPPPKAIVRSGNLVIEDLCRADNAAMPCV